MRVLHYTVKVLGSFVWEERISSYHHCHVSNRGASCFLFKNGWRKKTHTNRLPTYQLWAEPSSLSKFQV